MRVSSTLLSAIAATMLLFASCNGSSPGRESSSASLATEELSVNDNDGPGDGSLQIPVSSSNQQQLPDTVSFVSVKAPAITWNKKIVKSCDLTLEAASLKEFSEGLHQLLSKHGAYIAKEESRQSERFRSSQWVIKVPVLQFEDLLNELPGKESVISSRDITSDDVTNSWFDTKYRLEAKRQMRAKYSDFLSRAKTMEEMLQVQQEINRLQEEIESATGRMHALEKQSAYSTINLSVTEVGPGMITADETPGIFRRLAAAFKSGANGFAYLLVGLVSVWPLVLLAGFGIYFLRKKNPKIETVKQ